MADVAGAGRAREFALLGLLALLWGSSYLFIKVAVAEIPPLTLIAARVTIAAAALLVVMRITGARLPRGRAVWAALLVQAVFNSIAAWTLLAWGQQFTPAATAAVLNSTAPMFVFLFTAFLTRGQAASGLRLFGACLGFAGVALIMGEAALDGLSAPLAGQAACVFGAVLYACAAIYGRRFASLGALPTATGTMIWAAVTLAPAAMIFDAPWTLAPSPPALGAALILGLFCTALALLIYFRLLGTLGALGTASQAYLRAGVGAVLGVAMLGEVLSAAAICGIVAALLSVAMINWRRA